MFNLEGIDQDALALLTPIELALFWAARGVPVVPTDPDTKAPFGKAWQHRATTDPDTIRSWPDWARGARVGIKTGLSCGVGCQDGPDVLDFDVSEGKPGIKQMGTLAKAGLIDWATAMVVQTPSGGTHWWFAGTTGHNKQNVDEVWGVDFRAHHGMVLAPGNPDYTIIEMPTEPLAQIKWDEIAACPGLLAKPRVPTTGLPAQPATRTAPPPTDTPLPPPVSLVGFRGPNRLVAPKRAFDDPIGEESPLDWYTRNHDIEQVLVSAGWQFVHESEGKRHFVRPGKKTSDGVSGNIAPMADGRLVFYNFSSSTELPTDRALSTAQLYAWFYHGGDMRAAAGAVRRTLMPQRSALPSPPTNYPASAGMPMGVPVVQASGEAPRPGTDLVPQSLYKPPQHVRDFWRARPELREIWFQAGETDYSPWAILGYVLAMVDVRVGPHVQLPPRNRKYGGPASLNLFVAIVGDTGDGKDEASKLARPFIGAPKVPTRKPGTGQGIAALYTEMNPKEGPVQVNDTAYLHESEITGLGAHSDMQGSNLVSTLLSVYMAQELGEHYANKEKRRPVPEGRYRLALTVGVQPSNSHILLDEERAASGLPQRFLWMPAIWPDSIYGTKLKAPAPGYGIRPWRAWEHILPGSLSDEVEIAWSPTDAVHGLKSPAKEKTGETQVPFRDPIIIEYVPELWAEIERVRRARSAAAKTRKLQGERSAGTADSHVILTQLKVAALLSIWLDHSLVVSWEMWQLASCVMWVSDRMRIESGNELREKSKDAVGKRAAAQAAVTALGKANETVAHDETVTRAATRLRHLLGVKAGVDGWCSTRVLNQGLSSKEKREWREAGVELADVMGDLALLGLVEIQDAETGGHGAQYRLK